MRKRIFSIMDMSKKRTGLAVICCALIVTMCTGAAFAANAQVSFPNHLNFPNAPTSASSQVKIGDNSYEKAAGMNISSNKKISFDIESIGAGENVKLGGYTLKKGDTVQIESQNSGNKINISISAGNKNANAQSSITEIPIGMKHTIQQDGEYYFYIQNNAASGVSNDIKGVIQLTYQTSQMVQDERLQFTDDDSSSNMSHSTGVAGVPTQQSASAMSETADSNKSAYDGMFDDNSTVLKYYGKNSYIADDYKTNISNKEASLKFRNFSGSQIIYELSFEQDTIVDFKISADADGEYKIVFITENDDVLMKASTYNWIPASRPIELLKGKTRVVLVGEKVTGNCNISLDY